jgi:hypothetical protein
MSQQEKVGLPELEEVSDEQHVKRVQRWHDRLFDLIDATVEVGCRPDDSEAHAGMEAEWELMQREEQLLAALARIAELEMDNTHEVIRGVALRYKERMEAAEAALAAAKGELQLRDETLIYHASVARQFRYFELIIDNLKKGAQ